MHHRRRSRFDDALLTGESVPVKKGIGADVYAGSINLEQAVTIRAAVDTRHDTHRDAATAGRPRECRAPCRARQRRLDRAAFHHRSVDTGSAHLRRLVVARPVTPRIRGCDCGARRVLSMRIVVGNADRGDGRDHCASPRRLRRHARRRARPPRRSDGRHFRQNRHADRRGRRTRRCRAVRRTRSRHLHWTRTDTRTQRESSACRGIRRRVGTNARVTAIEVHPGAGVAGQWRGARSAWAALPSVASNRRFDPSGPSAPSICPAMDNWLRPSASPARCERTLTTRSGRCSTLDCASKC